MKITERELDNSNRKVFYSVNRKVFYSVDEEYNCMFTTKKEAIDYAKDNGYTSVTRFKKDRFGIWWDDKRVW